MITVEQVSKHYGEVTALDSVNLNFEEEKIYGLLGRNGAGKSTLLNIITNRIFPDAGRVLVDGQPVLENDRALRKLYLMSERTYYPPNMRVRDVLRWTGEFYPGFDSAYAASLCDQFGLKTQKRVKELSTGYSSILKIIVSLSLDIPYLLLDEPVLGLDANHRDLFYRLMIESYSERPRTIVISTHLIEEVASVIENIVIIKDGKVIRDESCESLLAQGYTVTGAAAAVERYIEGRQLLGADTLGGLKSAYLIGKPDKTAGEGLEFSGLDLQKLFIQLTNS